MKKIISLLFVVLMVLCISGSAQKAEAYKFAENWSKEDTAWQATFLAVTTVDWMQTRWMAKQDWQWDGEYYREINPILGSHPSIKKVDTLIPLGMVAHTLIAMAIPPRSVTEEQEKNGAYNVNFRRVWQCLCIGVESAATYKNYSIGVKLEF